MHIATGPFDAFNWDDVPATIHPGEVGEAQWRTRMLGDIRVRMVDYSPGYLADHWCEKGHVVLCVSGAVDNELSDGTVHRLTPGMSYTVADGVSSHRSRTDVGVRLFIVD